MEGDNRGARSGNTFRKIGSKFQKSKQPRAVIIRHSSNLSRRQSSNEADDGYISADAVQYSLNKKGRWNLPEVIQENIFDHDFDDDFSEVRVSMLHRHLVNRQSDCLRVITNTLRDDQGGTDFSPRRKKARRRTYCNGMNILHNGRGKQTKNPRKKQVISTKLDIAARKAELQEAKAERDCRSASDIEDSKGSNSTPEVRYDVFYPLPAMSSLRSHPKFAPCLVRPDDIEQPLRVTAGLKAGKRSKKRNKYVQMDDTFFDDDCFFEDDFDENYSEEDMLSAKSFPENCSSPFATSLSEVLEEALYVASRQPSDPEDFGLADFDALAQASGKPRRKRSSKKKDRKYVYQTEQTFQTDAGVDVTAYTEDTQSDTSSELDSSTDSLVLLDKLTSMRMKSVRVVLPEESVSGSALSHQYGNTYTEAGCLPRKFLIDITDRARESLKHVQSFRDVYLPSVDLSSCVVFSYDCEDVESGAVTASVERHYVYSVTLNMNYQDHDFVINTLDKMARYDSVEVVLERVLEFICTLPHDKLVRKDVECPPCALENKIQPDFRMVTEVNGWNPSFLSLSSVSCLPAASRPTTRQSAHVNGFDGAPDANKADREALGAEGDAGVLLCQSLTPEPGYCSICFDDISPGCSGAAPTATALSGCGHWFCNTCWLSHLSLTARGGVSGATRRTLECPEYGCRVEVDVGTLLSLLHVRDVQLLVRRRLDLQMTGSRRAKWCPNPLCGRLIQLNTERSNKQTEPTSLACTCGTRLCFKCLGTAHWPASCAEAKEYHALLVKRGDTKGASPDVMVSGKPCPACGAFLEKRGGCNHMICVCGQHFCWWCLRSSCICQSRYSDSFGIQRRVIKHVDTSPREGSQWYELAIQHRRMQYKQEVKMNIKMADQLAGRLLAFTWKRSEAGMPFSVSSAANLNETVAGILKLKLELHHVIEHTAAALDVSSKDVATVAPKSARTKDASNKVISMTFIKAKDVVGRLEFLCSSLDLLLKVDTTPLRRVVPTFQLLQREARDALRILAALKSQSAC